MIFFSGFTQWIKQLVKQMATKTTTASAPLAGSDMTNLATEMRHLTLERSTSTGNNSGLGFTLRGGIEHGLGHFVSAVDPGSEAERQGLRPGDQIVAVGSLALTGATHKEAVTLIASSGTKVCHFFLGILVTKVIVITLQLELQVQRIGAIPIKSNKGDPITWLPCSSEIKLDKLQTLHSSTLKQQSTRANSEESPVVKPPNILVPITLRIKANSNQGLGCIICRGPFENPGIFVQTIKPGGLALEAGLQSGDQIVECNGVNFDGLSFQDAVYQLKSSPQLDLIIRKGAGTAFIAEKVSQSSSSASHRESSADESVKDDQDFNTKTLKLLQETVATPVISDLMQIQEKERQKLDDERRKLEQAKLEFERKKLQDSSQDDHEEEKRQLEAERRKLERTRIALERKKLEAEADKLRRETEELEQEKIRFQEQQRKNINKSKNNDSGTSSGNDSLDSNETTSTGGLAGAIQNELQRRKANLKSSTVDRKLDVVRTKKVLPSVIKNDQHDKLIEEFRKVHRKMFSGDDPEMASDEEVQSKETDTKNVTFNEHVTTYNTDTSTSTNSSSSSSGDSCHRISKPRAPPPPPPLRSSSIASSSDADSLSSSPKQLSTFKPPSNLVTKPINVSPKIPTPDYDMTPECSPIHTADPPSKQKDQEDKTRKKQLTDSKSLPTSRSKNSDKVPLSKANSGADFAFGRRNMAEVGSLQSYVLNESHTNSKSKVDPPNFYFEKGNNEPLVPIVPYVESVQEPERFNFLPKKRNADILNKKGIDVDEALIAAQDYRVANAVGINGQTQVEILTTLSRRKQVTKTQKKTSKRTKNNVVSQNTSSDEDKVKAEGSIASSTKSSKSGPPKSVKKHPAPPPPPPPPSQTLDPSKGIKWLDI